MPYIEVNQAQIYYQAYGEDQPAAAPIILIHGATGTGQSNWGRVAPALASRYRVIVPDCRGHGRSSSPFGGYSFRQLADDVAELVHALGYERAHIIGHSNGGNVALVTLLEHPQVVQSCVIQAGNAYVSQDLIEKEPPIFDPDRVSRDAPAWMEDMIHWHGETHGKNYWRELLQMTVAEIIREPNYTPQDLERVAKPVLVVQGAQDHVNAPARHAQFIADHIRLAELWLPEGVDHNVHDERLVDWLAHILDFLQRRGDDINESLYRLKSQAYQDDRETVFEVHFEPAQRCLRGRVLEESQHQAVLELVREIPVQDHVTTLLTPAVPWALINRPVCDLRKEPGSLKECISQGLLGDAVQILREENGWSFIRLERDNYLGWVVSDALWKCSVDTVRDYANRCTFTVIAGLADAYDQPGLESPQRLGKIPFGVRVCSEKAVPGWRAVQLPGGRLWWVAQGDLVDSAGLPPGNAQGIRQVLNLVSQFIGVPYLWGGCTPFGFDCSGLSRTFYAFLGHPIPRDADQQFNQLPVVFGEDMAALPVEQLQPGDLLYFGSLGEKQKRSVTHVALSLGGPDFIHASGSNQGVTINSFAEHSPRFNPWLRSHLLGVRRVL